MNVTNYYRIILEYQAFLYNLLLTVRYRRVNLNVDMGNHMLGERRVVLMIRMKESNVAREYNKKLSEKDKKKSTSQNVLFSFELSALIESIDKHGQNMERIHNEGCKFCIIFEHR